MASRIPSLRTIYKGHTYGDDMIAWVKRVAEEYDEPTKSLVTWADRDRRVLYDKCEVDGAPMIEDEVTYWLQAMDALLARHQHDNVRYIVTYDDE